MNRLPHLAASLCLSLAPAAAAALPLEFPAAAVLAAQSEETAGILELPTGPHADGFLPLRRIEGRVLRQVWQVPGSGLSAGGLAAPIRDQLAAAGWTVLLDCQAAACGGYDFRLGIEVMAPPAMFLDLGGFRFLAAESGDGTLAVSVLTSATSRAGYIQVIQVAPPGGIPDDAALRPQGAGAEDPAPAGEGAGQARPPGAPPAAPGAPGGLAAALAQNGRVILSDLAFPSGSAQLAEGRFASLEALADYLRADPARRIALVGHTDAQGTLAANIALSRRRAGSVLERLAADYGIPRRQMEAEGVGYLAPIASNLSPEGREANRRVEAIALAGAP